MSKYSAALMMLGLGLICLVLHVALGWSAFQAEAESQQTAADPGAYLLTWGRDVFENLQSEFIQLFFQFLLLAGFFKALKIRAYEEDVEEVKKQLTRLESTLATMSARRFEPTNNGGADHERREVRELVGV